MINLTINGIEVSVEEGTTILKAAKQAGIYIPTLCYDEAVAVYGACGLCVVEAEGIPKLLRSCSAKCSEGMVVKQKSCSIKKNCNGTTYVGS
jgi:formate dehydrogenase major subunit